MFAAAIFDMDGLLIDSEQAVMRAWLAACEQLDAGLTRAHFLSVVGLNRADTEAALTGLLGSRERFLAIATLTDTLLANDPAAFPLKPGAQALVAELAAASVPCAVASSSRASEIRLRLGEVGLLDHFAAVAGGNEVARGKPDPAVYELAATRLGVAPGDCLAFEDSENGARAALAAGLQVVVVPDLKPPPEAVLTRCLHVFDSLGEARPYLPRWFPALA